jgi:hypothetical protein
MKVSYIKFYLAALPASWYAAKGTYAFGSSLHLNSSLFRLPRQQSGTKNPGRGDQDFCCGKKVFQKNNG